MFSFRFLNRQLVDKYPYQGDDICYINPDIICKDLPPNRLRFLGTW
jgi:transposase